MKKPFKIEGCDCADCQEKDEPCYFDCDCDEMCLGCQQAAEIESDDAELEEDWRNFIR